MVEFKVTLDNLLTFVGLLFVAWQMRDGNNQRKIESQIRLQDINRELISLGFDHPELFEVLKDGGKADATLTRRYLQLWLNQLSLYFALKSAGTLQRDFEESCEQDFRDMFELPNMLDHWNRYGKYYTASFRKAVEAIRNEAALEQAAKTAEETKT
jgi:hypothetical protein